MTKEFIDFISGSKMAGMESILTTDCQLLNGEEAGQPGPQPSQEMELGGCLFLRKLLQSLIKTTTVS